ncbi:hypothetical protein AB3R30_14915 [Leptolyngbyaceae cyanobacterium UHCC 1019]
MMQRLLSATAFSFVLVSGIFVPQVSAKPVANSLISRGHPQTLRSPLSQTSEKQTQPTSEPEAAQQPRNTSTPKAQDKPTSERRENTEVPAYCALPPNVIEGSFEYREELYNCKYGL